MAASDQPIKLARDLPPPPKLTEEDIRRIDAEATQWCAAVSKGTETLERLTSEDLCIRLR